MARREEANSGKVSEIETLKLTVRGAFEYWQSSWTAWHEAKDHNLSEKKIYEAWGRCNGADERYRSLKKTLRELEASI